MLVAPNLTRAARDFEICFTLGPNSFRIKLNRIIIFAVNRIREKHGKRIAENI